MALAQELCRVRGSCIALLAIALVAALLVSEEEFVSVAIARLKQMREEDSIESAEAFTVTPAPERNATKDILDVYSITPFRGVNAMCNGDVRLQSAFCDYEGHCMVTGIANTRGDYRTNLIRKTVILDVDGQRLSTVNPIHVKFVGDNHNKLRDTFIMKFKLKEEDAARVAAFNSTCYTKLYKQKRRRVARKQFPIVLRKREFKDYVAMMVTQYYSPVDLEWIEVFLKHYFSIGVDYIALYTGFSERKYDNYSQTLNTLIETHPTFKGRVVRYEWGAISNIRTWSFSQTAMLNHGANVFMGSVIFHADLDEILYPVHHENIKSIAHRYNEMYGNWAFKFNSYKGKKWLVTGKLKAHKYHLFDFTKVYKRSRPCHGAEWHPNVCRAKYMYRSMSVDYLRIHLWSFTDATLAKDFDTGEITAKRKFVKGETTYCNGKWMNESDAVLLHLRGIQGYKGFSNEYSDDVSGRFAILGAPLNETEHKLS